MSHASATARPDWVSDEMFPFESRFFATADGHRMHYVDERVGPGHRVRSRQSLVVL